MRRFLGSLFVIWSGMCVIAAGPAAADAAGPTDYRTEVLSVVPEPEGIAVEIIGGDSFVQLTVEPGTVVEVSGYFGEPYLLFAADGTVSVNQLTPTRLQNDDRYGTAADDPEADAWLARWREANRDAALPEVEPAWTVVASGGRYAWHDHRTHWMNEVKPPGAEAGDTVLEAALPLVVDGEAVEVLVRSALLAGPSPWPWLFGGLVGLVTVGAAIAARSPAVSGGVALAWAGAALIVGVVAYTSVPAETGPSLLLWAPAALAVAVALLLLVRRRALSATTQALLVGFVGLELVWWAVPRRDALVRALIPTDAPGWLDRFVIAGALAAGAALLLSGFRSALMPTRSPD